MKIRIKRVYDKSEIDDGYRVLIDRVWPRGMTKQTLKADLWLKDIAPSTSLRKWFNHEPGKWQEFRKHYTRELDANHDVVKNLAKEIKKQTVTLLFSARDKEHNQAVVLQEYLQNNFGK